MDKYSDKKLYYFVPLAGVSSPEFIVPTIADALGLSFSGLADPLEEVIRKARQY